MKGRYECATLLPTYTLLHLGADAGNLTSTGTGTCTCTCSSEYPNVRRRRTYRTCAYVSGVRLSGLHARA